MSPPRVPPPYDAAPKSVQQSFLQFHKKIGKWPWDFAESCMPQPFLPPVWGSNLVSDLSRFFSVDLPTTPGVSIERVIELMIKESEHHPVLKYRSKLSRLVVAKATKWLADKREECLGGQNDSDSGSESDTSIRNEPLPFNRRMKTRQSTAAQSRPRRTARKRPYSYSVEDCFRLHNIDDDQDDQDDDEDGPEKEVELEHAQPESSEPAAKKRLMVHVKISPQNAHQLPRLDGDNTMISVEAGQRSRNNGEELPLSATTNDSFNDAQAAYVERLKDQIAKSDESLSRTSNNLANSTKRHSEIIENSRSNIEARERAWIEASEAYQTLQRKRALCVSEDLTLEAYRQASNDNSVVDSEAQVQMREAEALLRSKERRIKELTTKIQMDETQASELPAKIADLSRTKDEEEKKKRHLCVIYRLVVMGSKVAGPLDEVLGEKSVEQWTEEKMRDIQQRKS